MKLKLLLLVPFIIVALFFVPGCTNGVSNSTTNSIVCNKPYILVGNSCCLDSNSNNVCDKDEQKPIITPSEDSGADAVVPDAESSSEFKLKSGEVITVAGKSFRLVEFSIFQGKLETIVEVDNINWVIPGTKKSEIVNGLRITPQSVDKLQSYVTIKVEPFKLASDEYLFTIGDTQTVLGKVLRLVDIQDDKAVNFEVVDSRAKLFIPLSESKVSDGLRVTNVESFYRDLRSERYAVLKVERA